MTLFFLYAKSAEYTYHPAKERQIYQKPFRHTKRDAAGRYYVDSYLRDIWDHDDTNRSSANPRKEPAIRHKNRWRYCNESSPPPATKATWCWTRFAAAPPLVLPPKNSAGNGLVSMSRTEHMNWSISGWRCFMPNKAKTHSPRRSCPGGYTQAHYTVNAPVRGKEERQEQGYVYVIGNHSWPNIYKVGIAKDPKRRLNSYQTSDPYRAYTLCYAQKTAFYKEIEQEVHNQLAATNEWIAGDVNEIIAAIKKLARQHR